MSSPYQREFDGFGTLLSAWKGAYVCAVHSYVGVKTTEGSRLLYGRVLLEPSLIGINESPFRFATEHIVAGRFVKTAAVDIAALIVKAKAGEMDGLDDVVSLAAETSGSFSAYFAPIKYKRGSGLAIKQRKKVGAF